MFWVYNDYQQRLIHSRATRPSSFLKTDGYFIRDSPDEYSDALFQGGLGTQLSYLKFEEPGYTDINSRFGGSRLSSNQAIIVRGKHDSEYLGISVTSNREQIGGTFTPPRDEKFALVVLRSYTFQENLEKRLKGYSTRYVFINDTFSFSDEISVVIEKTMGTAELDCGRYTTLSPLPHVTKETSSNAIENFSDSKVTIEEFEKFLSGYFYKNHSIEKKINLTSFRSEFGGTYRQISEPIDFEINTFITLMTTSQKGSPVQFGVVDENNRVLSSEIHSGSDEDSGSESSPDENLLKVEFKPSVNGKYRVFSTHFCQLADTKPVNLIIPKSVCVSGTKYKH